MKTHIWISRALPVLLYIFSAVRGAEAGSFSFSNSAPITINDFGPATPYPATIVISGFNARITDLNIVLTGLSHTFPEDIGVLLVGPGGQKVVLMNNTGGINPISSINLTIDDQASTAIPDPISGSLPSGTYKPTNLSPADTFDPPPLAAGPYSTSLAVFNGTFLNGTWSLFIRDFSAGDGGQLASGFSLQGTTPTPEPQSLLLRGVGLITSAAWLRRRRSR
jgi:subtilisin-like proprotein convertase family protein